MVAVFIPSLTHLDEAASWGCLGQLLITKQPPVTSTFVIVAVVLVLTDRVANPISHLMKSFGGILPVQLALFTPSRHNITLMAITLLNTDFLFTLTLDSRGIIHRVNILSSNLMLEAGK